MAVLDIFLPDELIFDILSWLPIKSLLRFKCVCKIWCSTIEDPMFIDKHMKQQAYEMICEEDQGTEFSAIVKIQGVTLEIHNINNKRQRLRNHATREIFNLPTETERKGVCTTMYYILPTNELKVVYIDSSKQGNEKVLIYNILRIGTHLTWRRLDSSFLGNLKNLKNDVHRLVGSVLYNLRYVEDLYIECFDLENESITSTKVPRDLFYNWTNVWVMNWNGKLALTRIEQDQLNIRVFEDYRIHKWAESNIVIPLRFFMDFLSPSVSIADISPDIVEGSLVFLRTRGYYNLFSFDIQSKKVECLTPLSAQRKL